MNQREFRLALYNLFLLSIYVLIRSYRLYRIQLQAWHWPLVFSDLIDFFYWLFMAYLHTILYFSHYITVACTEFKIFLQRFLLNFPWVVCTMAQFENHWSSDPQTPKLVPPWSWHLHVLELLDELPWHLLHAFMSITESTVVTLVMC